MVITEVKQHPTVPLFIVTGVTYNGKRMLAPQAFQSRLAALDYAHAATHGNLPADTPCSAEPVDPVLDHGLTPVRPCTGTTLPNRPIEQPDAADLDDLFGQGAALRAAFARACCAFEAKPSMLNRQRVFVTGKQLAALRLKS